MVCVLPQVLAPSTLECDLIWRQADESKTLWAGHPPSLCLLRWGPPQGHIGGKPQDTLGFSDPFTLV